MNSITVFSNGIASKSSVYKIKKGEKRKIAHPVKKDHVADVLTSYHLTGDVKLTSPPSFPTDATGVLTLETQDVLEDIGNKLSGAEVVVKLLNQTEQAGTLIGTDTQVLQFDRQPLLKFIVLFTEEGIKKFHLNDVRSIEFPDAEIKKEIERALSRNLQKVKPNSVVVELEVSNEGDKDTEACLQYSVPAAAWKISYRLNVTGEKAEFRGLAIVDNNTEENWDDVIVSVVTGDPITFSTDIAEAKCPKRKHVNIVRDEAAGAVEVESFGGPMRQASMAKSARVQAWGTSVMGFDDDANSMQQMAAGEIVEFADSAITSQAEVKEQGDFCIFTAKAPVTIVAHSSAVIPVFDAQLAEAKSVLHYKEANHSTRPYRSIEFENETDHSLERGVCTINLDGLYSGSCIVPGMKKGEKQLLPHALETGVKISVNQKHGEVRMKRLYSRNGGFILEKARKIETNYDIENIKDESFHFYLEHPSFVTDEDFVNANIRSGSNEWAKLDGKPISGARRYDFDLPAFAAVGVCIIETFVEHSSIVMHDMDYDWLYSNYIENNGPLAKIKDASKLLEQCKKVSSIRNQKQQKDKELNKLTKRSERLLKNVSAGGEGAIVDGWRLELSDCDKKITQIEDETLPALDIMEEAAIDLVLKTLEEIASKEFSVTLK